MASYVTGRRRSLLLRERKKGKGRVERGDGKGGEGNFPQSQGEYNKHWRPIATDVARSVVWLCFSVRGRWTGVSRYYAAVSNPRCFPLSQFLFTPFWHRLLLAVMCQHDVIHKPEVHNVSQHRQRRTEPHTNEATTRRRLRPPPGRYPLHDGLVLSRRSPSYAKKKRRSRGINLRATTQ